MLCQGSSLIELQRQGLLLSGFAHLIQHKQAAFRRVCRDVQDGGVQFLHQTAAGCHADVPHALHDSGLQVYHPALQGAAGEGEQALLLSLLNAGAFPGFLGGQVIQQTAVSILHVGQGQTGGGQGGISGVKTRADGCHSHVRQDFLLSTDEVIHALGHPVHQRCHARQVSLGVLRGLAANGLQARAVLRACGIIRRRGIRSGQGGSIGAAVGIPRQSAAFFFLFFISQGSKDLTLIVCHAQVICQVAAHIIPADEDSVSVHSGAVVGVPRAVDNREKVVGIFLIRGIGVIGTGLLHDLRGHGFGVTGQDAVPIALLPLLLFRGDRGSGVHRLPPFCCMSEKHTQRPPAAGRISTQRAAASAPPC